VGRKLQRYQGEGIGVTFEPARCIHAAECVRGLPDVFDPQRRPWVEPGRAANEAIADVVRRCPTGALTYELAEQAESEAAPPVNSVEVRPRGPLYVRGELELSLPDGRTLHERRMALCRCGVSENKPFCDNSHSRIEFGDAGACGENRLSSEGAESKTLRLRAAPGGPLLVNGPLEVSGAVGETQCGEKGALCRCGASQAKPYCDGSHRAIGFEVE